MDKIELMNKAMSIRQRDAIRRSEYLTNEMIHVPAINTHMSDGHNIQSLLLQIDKMELDLSECENDLFNYEKNILTMQRLVRRDQIKTLIKQIEECTVSPPPID